MEGDNERDDVILFEVSSDDAEERPEEEKRPQDDLVNLFVMDM